MFSLFLRFDISALWHTFLLPLLVATTPVPPNETLFSNYNDTNLNCNFHQYFFYKIHPHKTKRFVSIQLSINSWAFTTTWAPIFTKLKRYGILQIYVHKIIHFFKCWGTQVLRNIFIQKTSIEFQYRIVRIFISFMNNLPLLHWPGYYKNDYLRSYYMMNSRYLRFYEIISMLNKICMQSIIINCMRQLKCINL